MKMKRGSIHMQVRILVGILCIITAVLPLYGEPVEFEGTLSDSDWLGEQGAELAISTNHFKGGQSCLAWKGGGTVRSAPLHTVTDYRKWGSRSLGFWVYRETPSSQPLILTLYGDERPLASRQFSLDYTGWRPLGVGYKQDLALFSGTPIHHVTLSFGGSDTVYIDTFDPALNAPGPVADQQQPWAGLSDGLPQVWASPGDDPAAARPWLPALRIRSQISDAEWHDLLTMEGMGGAAGHKNISDAGAVAFYEKCRKDLALERRGGWPVGVPVVLNGINEPAGGIQLIDYMKRWSEVAMFALSDSLSDNVRAQLQDLYLLMCEHFLDQGWQFGNNNTGDIGNGYTYRRAGLPEKVISTKLLAEYPRREELLLGILWSSNRTRGMLEEHPTTSTDILYNNVWHELEVIKAMPASAQKFQWLQIIGRYVALSPLSILTPDGGMLHHKMNHLSYAGYSYPYVMKCYSAFAGTCFQWPNRDELRERLKRWCIWRVYAMPFPPHAYGRPSLKEESNQPANCLTMALPLLRLPDGSYDRELAGYYLHLTPADDELAKTLREQGFKALPPYGHLSFNVAATAYHKRKGWSVSIATVNWFYRGYELYMNKDWVNYRSLIKNGSLFVCPESPRPMTDFGWPGDMQVAGFNWNCFPGVTTVPKASYELARWGSCYGTARTPLGGGTSLDGNGVWGMEDVNGGYRKSAFFFGDRITVVTTGIQSETNNPTITTLYQQFMTRHDEPVVVNGAALDDFPLLKHVDLVDKANWLLDRNQTGYYLHPNDGVLQLSKSNQSWIYMSPEYLKEGATMADVMKVPTSKEREAFFRPSTRDYHLAYISHGTNSVQQPSIYTVLPQTDAAAMSAFAESMANPEQAAYGVLRADQKAHVLVDRESGATGYVIFEPIGNIPEGQWIRASSHFCYAMVQPTGTGLTLSLVADPRAVEAGVPVTLVVDGHWRVEESDSVTALSNEGTTLLQVMNAGPVPLVFQLDAL